MFVMFLIVLCFGAVLLITEGVLAGGLDDD